MNGDRQINGEDSEQWIVAWGLTLKGLELGGAPVSIAG